MNSHSPVPRKLIELAFLPRAFIIVFVVVIAMISCWLFPLTPIQNLAMTLTNPEPLTAFYLENMSQADPNNTAIKIALAEQYIGLYEWEKADILLSAIAMNQAQHDQWVRLQFLKSVTQAYRLPKGPERTSLLAKLKENAPALLQLSLTTEQENNLGNLALKLDASSTALSFYEKVIKANPNQSAAFYQNIARIALENSKYEIAAQFYLTASKQQPLIELQRADIIDALKAYQAGNMMGKGINLLLELPDQVIDNQAMLLFLTKYTIAANRPDLATRYITRSLFGQRKP